MKPSSRNTRTVPKSQAAKPPTYTSNLGLTILQLPKDSQYQLSLIYSLALILLNLPIFTYVRATNWQWEGCRVGSRPHIINHILHSSQGRKSQKYCHHLNTPVQFLVSCPCQMTGLHTRGHMAGESLSFKVRINAHRDTGYRGTWVHNPGSKF